MKKILLSLFTIAILSSFTSESGKFPSINIKTLDSRSVNTSDYVGNGKLTVVSFWATWCSPCKRELDAMAELYPDWVDQYDIQFLAITIDDARGLAKVPATVKSKGWEFTVLSDPKEELKTALGFPTVPQTFIVDGQGNIVYSHSGYAPGDEFELEKKLKSLSGK
ncbi:MAG TPA: TlpA disulfide reductase family protein [Saprospiraceae bacterium]|nr:TlpA disulfide reductase family protein [Saprospiraceae bacterium]